MIRVDGFECRTAARDKAAPRGPRKIRMTVRVTVDGDADVDRVLDLLQDVQPPEKPTPR